MKKVYYFPLLLLVILGAVQYGCKEEADEICQSFDAQCGSAVPATTCCTDDECYYEFNGKKYANDADGMDALIADMCGTGNETSASSRGIKERLKVQTLELMAEARASVICQ